MKRKYTKDLEPVTVKLPPDQADTIQKIADYHDVSKSAVMRNVVFNGIRAHKYIEEFDMEPQNYEITE